MIYLKRFDEGYSDRGIKTTWQNPYKKNFGKVSLTELVEYLDGNKVPVVNVNPKSLKRYLIKGDRDLARVEKSDLNFPIILIKSGRSISCIIDGNHRLEKSLINEEEFIKTRTLDLDKAPEKFKMVFKAYHGIHKFKY